MNKNFKRRLLKLVPWAAFVLYKILSATWRVTIDESDDLKQSLAKNEPRIYAHWHGDELAILNLLKPYRASAIISTSDDGELMNKIIHLFGSKTSRGSSTRGGVSALRGILRLSKEGWNPSVAVDGPKGPRHKVKSGIFEISKIIEAPIFPLTAACDRAWTFEKAWNRAYLPKPFARVNIVFGPKISAVSRDQNPRDPSLSSTLEISLSNAQRNAGQFLAGLKTLC